MLSPPLRHALSVARRIQSAAPATRRALFANPRLFLREALGGENETLIDGIFHDTPAYSKRVIGLGLWPPRALPWVQVGSTDWFGGKEGAGSPQAPQRAGLLVGDTQIVLSPEEADDLRIRVGQRASRDSPPTASAHRSGSPAGDWTDNIFRLGLWTKEMRKSSSPTHPMGTGRTTPNGSAGLCAARLKELAVGLADFEHGQLS